MGNKVNKILLTGGGSGGPVSPLLAMVENLQENSDKYDFLWIGTATGPEKEMVEKMNINFKSIANGKLRRYFAWQNFVDPFKVAWGTIQSLFILLKWRPDLVMSVGAFVSVPVVWSAWLLRIPVFIHQQDIRAGLANKLMAPFATKITVTFKKSLDDYGEKAIWTGNPVRKSIRNADKLKKRKDFGLSEEKPLILVSGGGTGARGINKLIKEQITELTKKYQIVHLTGKGKSLDIPETKGYLQYEFLSVDDMASMLYLADLVISRCGLATLTELAYLKKTAILIPMPDTHQDDNAQIFAQNKASLVLNQKEINGQMFVEKITEALENKEFGKNISKVMKENANENLIGEIDKIL